MPLFVGYCNMDRPFYLLFFVVTFHVPFHLLLVDSITTVSGMFLFYLPTPYLTILKVDESSN